MFVQYIESALPCFMIRLFPHRLSTYIANKYYSISWTGKAEEWTEEELEQTAEAIGYGAVK